MTEFPSSPETETEDLIFGLRQRAAALGTHYQADIDFFRACADALAVRRLAQCRDQWRPIKTAPKDGSLIMIGGMGYSGWFWADAKWNNGWMMWRGEDDDWTEECCAVTHWIPLPAPPTLSDTSTDRPKCKLCGLEDGACICAHIPTPPQDPLRAAAERVCWFDWSDNDMDAAAAIDALRKALVADTRPDRNPE